LYSRRHATTRVNPRSVKKFSGQHTQQTDNTHRARERPTERPTHRHRHTQTHTETPTRTHTQSHTQTQTQTHTHIHTQQTDNTHTQRERERGPHTATDRQTHTHIHTHKHTNRRTHTYRQTRAHTPTPTHTHRSLLLSDAHTIHAQRAHNSYPAMSNGRLTPNPFSPLLVHNKNTTPAAPTRSSRSLLLPDVRPVDLFTQSTHNEPTTHTLQCPTLDHYTILL